MSKNRLRSFKRAKSFFVLFNSRNKMRKSVSTKKKKEKGQQKNCIFKKAQT